jgi:hypothetical protein
MTHQLLERRTAPLRGLVLPPGLVALLLTGPAYEDSGVAGLLLYGTFAVLSTLYVVRPTRIGWTLLFIPLLAYAVAVAGLILASPRPGGLVEGAPFLAAGALLAALVACARPMGTHGNRPEVEDSRPGA